MSWTTEPILKFPQLQWLQCSISPAEKGRIWSVVWLIPFLWLFRLFTEPCQNFFFLRDFPHGLHLAVHDHRRRAENAVLGDLHDVADLLDIGIDARLGDGLPNQFLHLLAIGATGSQVLWAFLTEAAILSMTGAILGIFIAYSGVIVIIRLFPDFPVHIPLWSIAASVFTAQLTGILFAVLPARRAAALDPVLALSRR